MKARTPTRCLCGARYDRFRTTMTFADVHAQMRTGSDDPSTWRNKSRRAVLGYWRELKIAQWHLTHGACPQEVRVVVDLHPEAEPATFRTIAAGEAFARATARLQRRPNVTAVWAGETCLARFRGDWRGAVTPIAVEPDSAPGAGDVSFDVGALEGGV